MNYQKSNDIFFKQVKDALKKNLRTIADNNKSLWHVAPINAMQNRAQTETTINTSKANLDKKQATSLTYRCELRNQEKQKYAIPISGGIMRLWLIQ